MKNKILEDIVGFSKSSKGKKLIENIFKIKLPENIERFVKRYEKTWGGRNRFLWKWSYSFLTSRNPKITFSCVPEKDFYKKFYRV